MLRLFGAALITVSSLLIGVREAKYLRSRTRKLEGLIALLTTLSAEISYRMTPLKQAFEVAANGLCNDLKPLQDKVYSHIEQHGPAAFGEAFRQAATTLDEPERTVLTDLSRVLGRYPADQQCAAIDTACHRLEGELKAAQTAQAKNEKVYIIISACLGIGAAIILI